jgi:hypothetical protein
MAPARGLQLKISNEECENGKEPRAEEPRADICGKQEQ